jgi:hypothetical protein
MSDLTQDLVTRLRDSATKVMAGVPRDQLLEAAAEIERLREFEWMYKDLCK